MGVLIAITLEVGRRPLAPLRGGRLPDQTSVPIFFGGALVTARRADLCGTKTSGKRRPGTLLSTGYIAGGTIAGVLVTFFAFVPIPPQPH